MAATTSIRRYIPGLLVALFALMAPFLVTSTSLTLLTTVGITAIVTLGMIFIIGNTGLVSLGHAALTATGAYTLAILANHTGLAWYVGLGLSAVAGGFVGLIVALPSLRVRGPYFAIITIILGFSVPQVVNLGSEYTGGEFGIYVNQIVFPGLGPVSSTYFLVVTILLAAMWFFSNVQRSEWGRALHVVRTHPVAATAAGLNAFRLQTIGVTLGNVLAGLAGGLLALHVGGVTPADFSLQASTIYLIAAVVGGTHSVYGAIVGAGVVELTLNALAGESYYANIVLGVILMVSLALLPNGLTELFRTVREAISYRFRTVSKDHFADTRKIEADVQE